MRATSTPKGRGGTRGKGRGRGGANTRPVSGALSNPSKTTTTLQKKAHVNNHATSPRASSSNRATSTRGGATSLSSTNAASTAPTFGISPNVTNAVGSGRPTSNEDRYQLLKKNRERERADAIRDGLLADPTKQRRLADAITPRGTCEDMCPEFERVERIREKDIKGPERDLSVPHDPARPWDAPADESRMVKKFRRSAAGHDEQLPSDLRPPQILKRTLDYLFDIVVGQSPSLGNVHHFVWDRTRAIRNDFSIQQVTAPADVLCAVECFERIARFHMVSLHVLAGDKKPYDQYDSQQEREQLDKTLVSLMQYYEDSRGRIDHQNEAEFRAYSIIFQIQSPVPDVESKIQFNWPMRIILDPRVQIALELYSAACNSCDAQGPFTFKPPRPHPIAMANCRRFWMVVRSNKVSYLMGCMAEIYFPYIRHLAIRLIWDSSQKLNKNMAKQNLEWSLDQLMYELGYDNEDQVQEFCERHGFMTIEKDDGTAYVDLNSGPRNGLPDPVIHDKPSSLVDQKTLGRTMTAIMNGVGYVEALQVGLAEPADEQFETEQSNIEDDEESLFVPESTEAAWNTPTSTSWGSNSGLSLNPEASLFQSVTSGGVRSSDQTWRPSESINFAFSKETQPFPTTNTLSSPALNPTSSQSAPSLGSNGSVPFSFSGTAESEPVSPKHVASGQQTSFSDTDTNTSGQNAANNNLTSSVEAPKQQAPSHPARTSSTTGHTKPAFSFSTIPNQPRNPSRLSQVENLSDSTPSSPTKELTPQKSFDFGESTGVFNFGTQPATGPAQASGESLFNPLPQQSPFHNLNGPSQAAFTFQSNALKPATHVPSEAAAAAPKFGSNGPQMSGLIQTGLLPDDVRAPAQGPRPVSRSSSNAHTPTTSFESLNGTFHTQNDSINTAGSISKNDADTKAFLEQQKVAKQSRSTALIEQRKAKLLDELAAKMIMQPGGFLDQYVEFNAAPMIRSTISRIKEEQLRAKADHHRTSFLMTKFGRKWHMITLNRRLTRIGRERRQRAKQAALDREKRQRQQSITASLEYSKSLLERRPQDGHQSTLNRPFQIGNESNDMTESPTGRKPHRTDPSPSGFDRTTASATRRTSTRRGAARSEDLTDRNHGSYYNSTSKSFDTSGGDPFYGIRFDTTRSTYFKLKAMGLDPNSSTSFPPPVSQLTKSSHLDTKRKRDFDAETDIIDSKVRKRAHTSSAADEEDQKLFEQLREARREMNESINFFREETAREEMRQSQASSRPSSAAGASIILEENRRAKESPPPLKYRSRVSRFLPQDRYAHVAPSTERLRQDTSEHQTGNSQTLNHEREGPKESMSSHLAHASTVSPLRRNLMSEDKGAASAVPFEIPETQTTPNRGEANSISFSANGFSSAQSSPASEKKGRLHAPVSPPPRKIQKVTRPVKQSNRFALLRAMVDESEDGEESEDDAANDVLQEFVPDPDQAAQTDFAQDSQREEFDDGGDYGEGAEDNGEGEWDDGEEIEDFDEEDEGESSDEAEEDNHAPMAHGSKRDQRSNGFAWAGDAGTSADNAIEL